MKLFCLIAYLMLMAVSVGIHLARHGEPRKDNYNFWTATITAAIELGLLWGMGVFEIFKN